MYIGFDYLALVNALMFIYRNKTLTPSAKVEGVSVKYSDRRIIVSAIILSVAGYCITGVFNDSIVLFHNFLDAIRHGHKTV